MKETEDLLEIPSTKFDNQFIIRKFRLQRGNMNTQANAICLSHICFIKRNNQRTRRNLGNPEEGWLGKNERNIRPYGHANYAEPHQIQPSRQSFIIRQPFFFDSPSTSAGGLLPNINPVLLPNIIIICPIFSGMFYWPHQSSFWSLKILIWRLVKGQKVTEFIWWQFNKPEAMEFW